MKDKIYRIVIELVVLSLCMFLVGCKNTEEQEKVKEPILDIQENVIDDEIQDEVLIEGEGYSMKVTMEYVCSEFGMSESDFDGIDFEDFVDEYNLTYEKIKRENVRVLLQCYKENLGKVKLPDYRIVFNNLRTTELTKENVNSIDIVYFSQINGEEHNFYIVDFEIGQIIEGSGSESMVSYDDIVGEANEQTKQKTIELFDKYDAYLWEQSDKVSRPIGTANGEVGTECRWYLKIKFNNGTIYRIYGDTLTDETAPENFDLFVEDLKALATSFSNE